MTEKLNDNLERMEVRISPDDDGVVRTVTPDELRAAGWSDDPGQGKAVMLPAANGRPGYEVISPMIFAPPIGYEPTPPIDELIRDRVRQEYDRLKGEDEVDDILDAEDFDVEDDTVPLETIYEVIAMKPEVPSLPKDSKPDLSEKVKADLEYEELLMRERLNRKRNREASIRKQQEEHELYSAPAPKTPAPGDAA